MIEDDRIPVEADDAIDALDAIRFVFRRDGFVSPKYLREKVDRAKYVLSWLEAIMEDEDE